MCVWTARPDGEHRLVPDGCVDVLWFDDGHGWLCGAETEAWTFRLAPGRQAVGLRFRPGMAPAALGFTGVEVANRRVPLDQLLVGPDTRSLAQQLVDHPAADDRLAIVEAAARRWVAAPRRPVDTVARAAAHVAGTHGRLRVDELARLCDLSPRQLHRRCLGVFGYGPTTLTRILRLQRFLTFGAGATTADDRGLATLAARAGYADQAHLARDCRALAGVTPTTLLRADLPR